MNKIPDRANVVCQLLGKGQGFADQPPNPLPKRVVDALHMVGLAALLADRAMPLGWQDGRVGRSEVTVTDGTLPIDRRQARCEKRLACRQRVLVIALCCLCLEQLCYTDNLSYPSSLLTCFLLGPCASSD